MDIQTKKENGKITVRLVGRLDTTTAPALEKMVREELSAGSSLVFDLEKLEYVSSAGLRIFLIAQKLMKGHGELKLINVAEPVFEIFEMTGFTDFLTIEEKA